MGTTINININTTGSLKQNGIKFEPSMVDSLIKTNTIYFPVNFLLDKQNMLKSNNITRSLMDILTNPKIFKQLVDYNTKYLPKNINRDIIKKNAEFIRKLFFADKSKIKIDNNSYVIVKSSIDTNSIRVIKQELIVMTVNLMISKETSIIAIKRLTCEEQRNNINSLFKEIFGSILFYPRIESTANKYTRTNLLYKVGNEPVKKVKPDKRDKEIADMERRVKDLLYKDLLYKDNVNKKNADKKPTTTDNDKKLTGGNKTRKRRRIKCNRVHLA